MKGSNFAKFVTLLMTLTLQQAMGGPEGSTLSLTLALYGVGD